MLSPTHPVQSPARSLSAAEQRGLGLLLALQLGLAVTMALSKSLVQDEFHTLFHAGAPDVATLLERLSRDNHPPAGFLAVRAARALLGDGVLALRLPQILFGLATTWFVARICARLGAPVLLGAALWAFSSTQLEFSTQVRMYALSALCCAGAVDALQRVLSAERPGARLAAGIALALWVCVGLHTHYYWVFYSGALAAAVLVAAALRDGQRGILRRVMPWGAAALIGALPWYLSTFRVQVAAELPPGMTRSQPTDMLESFIHMLMWNLRMGGAALRWVFVATGALVTVLAALGALRLWRGSRRHAALVLTALTFGVPLLTGSMAALWSRMGFNWNYVLPSAPLLCVLVAVCAGAPARAARAVPLLLVPLLGLSLFNVVSVGTENNRGAVRWVLEAWRPGDAVICVELQGAVFGQGLAWSYYAPRLAAEHGLPLPERLPVGSNFDALDPSAVLGHPRVFLLSKSAWPTSDLLVRLRANYPEQRTVNFGFGLNVYVFEQPATAGAESGSGEIGR
jgi:uncharacterized membrane protein